jgi:hypothetical protein
VRGFFGNYSGIWQAFHTGYDTVFREEGPGPSLHIGFANNNRDLAEMHIDQFSWWQVGHVTTDIFHIDQATPFDVYDILHERGVPLFYNCRNTGGSSSGR